MSRSSFSPQDIVHDIWTHLNLPSHSLQSLDLLDQGRKVFPSSFKISHVAQSTIGLSALAASTVHAHRNKTSTVPKVTVPADHAVLEFVSERLYTIDGKLPESSWGPIGGLHKTKDGYVRIHDNFPNHQNAALASLGLPEGANKEDVARKCLEWNSVDLEAEAFRRKGVIAALRSYDEWDATPQSKALPEYPVRLWKIKDGPSYMSPRMESGKDRCLQGLRVLELSRVIAAPVAGKTLAAHGADILWVTSPNLPDLPHLDKELSKGKKTIQLDLTSSSDIQRLLDLAKDTDVFINGYRPGGIAGLGFSADELVKVNPNIIIANLSAYGPEGPWAQNRGFDSLVQTCSGMNVSEAEHYGGGEPARPAPCQVLDHGAGYLLATGIIAAVYKRATEGGVYAVDVSLAGVMKYLRSLGQYEGKSGFEGDNFISWRDREGFRKYLDRQPGAFGQMEFLSHSAVVEGAMLGWDIMPKPLGSDEAKW